MEREPPPPVLEISSAPSQPRVSSTAGVSSSDKRPVLSRFKQQQLPAWQPILTPVPVILTFLAIGVVFLPIGIALLVASLGVVEVSVRYDTQCNASQLPCVLYANVPKTMNPTVYVYYRLDNFYQNHRRYAASRDDNQLNGGTPSANSVGSCSPIETTIVNGTKLPLDPCGLIAASTFNDTFAFARSATNFTVLSTDIAWASDLSKKFRNPANWTDLNGVKYVIALDLTLFPHFLEEERFVVWMRIAGLPSFRKLWGRIEQPVPAGNLTIAINSVFPVASFDGAKYVVLSTTSWAGGKNNFLGVAYIVVGALSLAISMILFVLHKLKPRRLGDPNYLRWK